MTEKLVISGGIPLKGDIEISGAKNSVLKLMSAALLTEDAVLLTNVPQIADTLVMSEVLRSLGRKVVNHGGGQLEILAGTVSTHEAPYELVSKMRASFNVLGTLLGRYGHSRVPLPGGCTIGKRGVDQHVKGLKALGAEVTMDHGCVEAKGDQPGRGLYCS